jgi:cytochrome d ubiquinol oxidase subunit II
MPIEYDILRLIWWALLGILLIGFAVLDGYDLGTAMLLPFVARTDTERRQVRETIEPTWEGHQVWFILGGGAAFAAWPLLYAAAFSGFYVAMLLVLAALIVRPVGFNFRDKIAQPHWRSIWDWALCIGGFVPSLVFGVAFGNLLQGVPFSYDDSLRLTYTGGFFGLLNPFGLLAGLLSVAMLVMHGGTWLALKTDGVVAERAARAARRFSRATFVLFALAGLWIAYGIDGYVLSGPISHTAPSNPLGKTVTREVGGWLRNYHIHEWLIAAPALGLAGPLLAALTAHARGSTIAFLASAVGIAGIVATAGLSLFPFLLPSSTNPDASLTVWDASSSPLTLWLMLLATIVLLPIVLIYTAFVLRVMRGRVAIEAVEHQESRY